MQATQGSFQAQLKSQDQLRPHASFWTWMFFWAITAPVGLPLWIIGVLVGVDRVQDAWFSLTLALVEMTCGKQDMSSQPEQSRPEEFAQEPLNDENLLSIVRCADGYYTRFVRVVDEMGFARRVDLTPIIPGELSALGLDDNLGCALKYTLIQIGRGIFRQALDSQKANEVPQKDSKASSSSDADHLPAAQGEDGLADKDSGYAAGAPAAKPAKPGKKASKKPAPSAGLGKVVSVGTKRFAPKGKTPYHSFAVTLEAGNGELFEFSGADLAGRFEGKDAPYKVGDTVRIESQGKAPVEVVEDGHRVTRHRKVFSVSRA